MPSGTRFGHYSDDVSPWATHGGTHGPAVPTVDLKAGYLDVHRVKRGHDSKHPLRGPQLRLLRELQRTYPDSPYVFVSERKAPLSPRSIREIVARAGKLAGLPFAPYLPQLRHACGYYLASHGHDTRAIQNYLGHKNIQHTVRYMAMAPHRFESFWNDYVV